MRTHIINNSVPGEEFKVCLRRECLTKPWGFRLQGGSDIGFPLTVQRVFSGSPAEGVLHRGDIILQIDNFDASHILHKEAQDLVRLAAGTELLLYLKRSSQGGRTSSAPSRSNSQDFTPGWCTNHTANSPGYSSLNRPPMRISQHQSKASFQPSNRGYNSFATHNGNNGMMTQSMNFSQNHDNEEEDDPYVYEPVSERRKHYQSQSGFSSVPRTIRPTVNHQFSFNQRSQSNPVKAPISSSTRWQPSSQRSASNPNYRQTSGGSAVQWQPNRSSQRWPSDHGHTQQTPAWQQKPKWPLETSVVTPWQRQSTSGVESDSRRQSKTSITLAPTYQQQGTSNKQIWPPQRHESVQQHTSPRGISYNVPVRAVINRDQSRPMHHNTTYHQSSCTSRPLNVTVPPHQSSTSYQNGMTIIENYHPLQMSHMSFYPAYPAYMNVRRSQMASQSFPASPSYANYTPVNVKQEPLYHHKRSTRALSVEADGAVKPVWYSAVPQYQQVQSSQPSPSQWTSSSNLYNPSPSYNNSMNRPKREIHRHQRGTSVPHDWGDAQVPSMLPQNRYYDVPVEINVGGDFDWSKSELAQLIHQEDMRQKHRPRDYASPERYESVAYRSNAPKIRTINRSSWGPGQHHNYDYRNAAEFEGTEF